MNTRQQLSKVFLSCKDTNGKIYLLRVTYCFSLDEAIKYIKALKRNNKENRRNCYIIKQRDMPAYYCMPYAFAVRKY